MGKPSAYSDSQQPRNGYGPSQNPAPVYGAKSATTKSPVAPAGPLSVTLRDVFFHVYLGPYDISSALSTDDFIREYVKGRPVKNMADLNRWDVLGITLNVITERTDITRVRNDLKYSLSVKDALVIYLGHTHPMVDNKAQQVVEAPLNPCIVKPTSKKPEDVRKALKQMIRRAELTTMVNDKNFKASAFIVASCASYRSFGRITDKKKRLVATDSGKNYVTPIFYFARALEVILDNITGYPLVSPDKQYALRSEVDWVGTSTFGEAINYGNRCFIEVKIDDRLAFLSGDGNMKY